MIPERHRSGTRRRRRGHHTTIRALLVSCLVLVGSPVWAAPDETPESETLDVLLKNVKGPDGKPGGCYFVVKGKTEPFVDGTRLQVTLQARGRSRDFPVKILTAVIKNNAYEVSGKWPGRVFAPLLYEVKVVLNVRKQNKKVRQWIMQEWGFAVAHQEILDRKRFGFGSVNERAEFAISNINRIMGFARRLEIVRAEVAAAAERPAAETPEWPDLERSLKQAGSAFRDDLDIYFRYYVILLEQGFYARLRTTLTQLGRIIRDYGRNIPGTAPRLDKLGQSLAKTIELLREHTPVTHEEALVEDDDEQPADGSEEETGDGNDSPDEENQ